MESKNPLIAELLTDEPTVIFCLEDKNYWLRDAHALTAIARAIPWRLPQIQIQPVLARRRYRYHSVEIQEYLKNPEAIAYVKSFRPGMEINQFLHGFINQMVEYFTQGEDSETSFQVPDGNLFFVGRPQIFSFYENELKTFLTDIVGFPGRFFFMSDEPSEELEAYRTIMDHQTGIGYKAKWNEATHFIEADYGFVFKKRINYYYPCNITIVAGTSTLGTWGAVEYISNPFLWQSIEDVKPLTEIGESIELLVRTEPQSKLPIWKIDSSCLTLVSYSFNYPFHGPLRPMETDTQTVWVKKFDNQIIWDVKAVLDSVKTEISTEGMVYPKGALLFDNLKMIKIDGSPFVPIVGKTAAEIHKEIESIATDDAPVLILGETGTGKEVVAGLIAWYRLRGKQKENNIQKEQKDSYIPINCAAVHEELIESELFGHVKGAFTDATSSRTGIIEGVGKGVVFLDEIGDLSEVCQPKLLRTLQNRQVRLLGENKPRNIFAKIIAATNRDLEAEVERGEIKEGKRRFRYDLLSRFPRSHRIRLKPLRERKQDIPYLIIHYLQQRVQAKERIEKVEIEKEALQVLLGLEYPANVRSLFDIMDSIVNRLQSNNQNRWGKKVTIEFEDLPPDILTNEFEELRKQRSKNIQKGNGRKYLIYNVYNPICSLKKEINDRVERIPKTKVTAEELNAILDKYDFKFAVQTLSDMRKNEEILKELDKVYHELGLKEKQELLTQLGIASLEYILGAVKLESDMSNEEKGKLIIELWESKYGCSINNNELEFLFEAGKGTPEHWKKAYREKMVKS